MRLAPWKMVTEWTRVGVDPAAPQDTTKHIVVTNQIALFFALAAGIAAFSPAQSLWSPTVRGMTIGVAVGMPFTLALNAVKRHLVAAGWMLALMLGANVVMARNLPNATHHTLMLLPLCVVAPFLFPGSQRRLAMVVTAVLCLAFAAILGWHVVDPPSVAVGAKEAAAVGYTNTLFVMTILVGIVVYATQHTLRVEVELSRARERSDRLIANMLPPPIAERLKHEKETIADYCPETSVLFADLVGFTPLSQTMHPAKLVALLDDLFSEFDALADEHGMEKIKTIGDAYMAVAGAPEPRADHALAAVRMALAMKQRVAAVAARTGHDLALRAGVHSGPVVAGVIGKRKYAYDLWGDTVNLASRMESHGMPNEVQVTSSTWEHIREHFDATKRESIQVKGAGMMTTYLVHSSGEG